VLFDRRGVGASQRDADDFSLEAQVADLSAVVDNLQSERADLWGVVDGAAISVAFAVQNPQRVGRVVLWSAYDCGVEIVRPGAGRGVRELIRGNWSLARRTIADSTFPSGSAELRRWFSDSLRETMDPEVAARQVEFYATVDVRLLLPQVAAPTLVLHRRGDRNASISAGRAVAALIPNCRFVALEGDAASPWEGDVSYLDIVAQFLGEERPGPPPAGSPASAVHTILFTDMESSTALTQRLGDAKAQELVRAHNTIVREALEAHRGSEIKHTGDGIMASFASASGALECAVAIQQGVAARAEEQPEMPLGVRIGLNAGEPVAEEDDLFGASVQLARRVCDHAEPGQIVVADVVRQLATGKGFLFSDLGDTALRGFEEPVRLYEVRWRG
jgi:class 3 adenylate cyclase